MSETRTTITIGGIALILALLALVTAPRRATPDAFLDKGELFFSEFDNPNEATSLEVIEFDEETAEARAFKVMNQEGRWTIPSHHNYPADGEDRLAQTAAGVIGIAKEDFRSDNVADHEAFGVIDPLDETVVNLKGRGKRVTMRGPNDQILADFIIGRELEDRENYRFVRIPDQKRVYVARMDIDISTSFEDWIEKDLLKVDQWSIDQVILRDYSIDEQTYRVDERDLVTLMKDGTDWKAAIMRGGEEVDMSKMNTLLSTLADLEIVGVRPKPEGLSATLERIDEGGLQITQMDMLSLQDKGYYFSRDGSLLSNEGELQARTNDGITYTLRFGEVVYVQGEAVTAGADTGETGENEPGENRYLFITTEFDPGLFPEPERAADLSYQEKSEEEYTDEDRRNKELHEAHESWVSKIEKGRELSETLNARFADWYYVISADSYEKIRLSRSDILTEGEKSSS